MHPAIACQDLNLEPVGCWLLYLSPLTPEVYGIWFGCAAHVMCWLDPFLFKVFKTSPSQKCLSMLLCAHL
jgi:hypothetical protein